MQQKTGKLRTRFRQNRPAKFIRVIFWMTLLLFVSSIVSIWLNDDQQVKSRMVFNAVSCFSGVFLKKTAPGRQMGKMGPLCAVKRNSAKSQDIVVKKQR